MMVLSWMVYSTLLALILGVAAALLETPVHQRGLPVRGLWMTAIAGTFLLPVVGRILSMAGASPAGVIAGGGALGPRSAGPGMGPEPRAVPYLTDLAVPAEVDVWLAGVWMICSTVGLLLFVALHAASRRRGRSWRPSLLDGRQVWISKNTGPAVFGFVRPRIVVPGWLLTSDAHERELVLLHEGEHIRAGDQHLLLAGTLALLALPWNIPLWWQWGRLRQALELDCDQRVLRKGMAPLPYSRLLLDVTERGFARRFVAAGLAESPRFLERRIRLMLRKTPSWGLLRTSATTLLASLLVVAACSMDQPSGQSTADLTLWVALGTYSIGTPDRDPLPPEDLRAELETALASSTAPTVLKVRFVGQVGAPSDVIVVARAACEAGVRRVEWHLDIPAARSTTGKARSVELFTPCDGGSPWRQGTIRPPPDNV